MDMMMEDLLDSGSTGGGGLSDGGGQAIKLEADKAKVALFSSGRGEQTKGNDTSKGGENIDLHLERLKFEFVCRKGCVKEGW